MKKQTGYFFAIILITSWTNITTVQAQSDPQYQWAQHLFDNIDMEYLQYAPSETRQLPAQMQQLGLDGTRIVFGRYNTPTFSSFRDVFEKVNNDSPVDTDALTSWNSNFVQGVTVYSRVFQIGNKGAGVFFYNNQVILADLGPYDESVDFKNQLIQKNQ